MVICARLLIQMEVDANMRLCINCGGAWDEGTNLNGSPGSRYKKSYNLMTCSNIVTHRGGRQPLFLYSLWWYLALWKFRE